MHQYLIDIIISYVQYKSIYANSEKELRNDSFIKFLYEQRILTLPCILKKYYEKNEFLFIEMCKRNDKENIKEYIKKSFNKSIKITDIDPTHTIICDGMYNVHRVVYDDMYNIFLHATPDLVDYFRSVYRECMENIN